MGGKIDTKNSACSFSLMYPGTVSALRITESNLVVEVTMVTIIS